jgi:hypothetical protein
VVEITETVDTVALEVLGSRRAGAVIDPYSEKAVAAVNCPLSGPNAVMKLLFR